MANHIHTITICLGGAAPINRAINYPKEEVGEAELVIWSIIFWVFVIVNSHIFMTFSLHFAS